MYNHRDDVKRFIYSMEFNYEPTAEEQRATVIKLRDLLRERIEENGEIMRGFNVSVWYPDLAFNPLDLEGHTIQLMSDVFRPHHKPSQNKTVTEKFHTTKELLIP